MYQDQEEEDDEEGEDEEEEEDEEDDEEGEDEGNLETDEESSDDDALDAAAPTPKSAQDKALEASLGSGLYPTFQRIHGPAQDLDPKDNDALEYLRLLWPESLCDWRLIGMLTKRVSLIG